MDVKGTLKAITLELRRELEGKYDAQGNWQAGDLERRLAAIGVRRDRAPVPVDELPHLVPEDREARRVVDAFLLSRAEAGRNREAATAEFVRDAAYTWANRLLALRCMEARALIDEVILQKDAYGGRSLQHNRLARKQPERCAGEDEGLVAALFDEFSRRADELPLLFDPGAREVTLRPSVAALKRCVGLLSGTLAVKGQEPATDELFTGPDALGWTYMYWNTEEKNRVFDKVRMEKGSKIEGAEIIPATCIYTEPYMVKFLVQNSLGAIWMGMNPDSRLFEKWEYYVRDTDRAGVSKKAVSDITFLDPACGSGHFLIEAFDLLYAMYIDEGALTDPAQICASILERNLYGIDIDERAVQIAALALVMKARGKAPDFVPRQVNLVATNIRLPATKEYLDAFLAKHPEDAPLKPALLAVFEGLAHADEIGSLLQVEEPVERELGHLRDQQSARQLKTLTGMLFGPRKDEDWTAWKHEVIERLRQHFGAEAGETDLAAAFFGEAASKGFSLVDLLVRRYDVVAANPPYMGSKNMGTVLKSYVHTRFANAKRDLYSAFVVRSIELVSRGGYVAMVTPDTWTGRAHFEKLRDLLLSTTRLSILVGLDRHAFQEADPPGLQTLFTLQTLPPFPGSALGVANCIGVGKALLQDQYIRRCCAGNGAARFEKVPLVAFEGLPGKTIVLDLHPRLRPLLASTIPADTLRAGRGISTGDNARFLRFWWETAVEDPAWGRFIKASGFSSLLMPDNYRMKWRANGRVLVEFPGARLQNLHLVNSKDPTLIVVGSKKGIISAFGPDKVFIPHDSCFFVPCGTIGDALVQFLGTRLAAVLFRALYRGSFAVTTLSFVPSAITALPVTEAARLLGRVKHNYAPHILRSGDVKDWEASGLLWIWSAIASSLVETQVLANLGIDIDERLYGTLPFPVGWAPMLAGYDDMPETPLCCRPVPDEVIESLREHRRLVLNEMELDRIRGRLRTLYEQSDFDGNAVDDENEGQDIDASDGADEGEPEILLKIPPQTDVESFSAALDIHPVSVFWLLKEGIGAGWHSREARRNTLQDRIAAIVLAMMGVHWPKDVELCQQPGELADGDGVLPLTAVIGQSTLSSRIRDRLSEQQGPTSVALDRECEEILGLSLIGWLSTDFFKRHISQFRKRPIVWHIKSAPEGHRRLSPRAATRVPAFSCFVYYRRLDADLLPKIRTQYVGPLRTTFQTELGSLEKLSNRTASQDSRRLELDEKVAELGEFDARLEQVIVGGFTSPALNAVAVAEPLDNWASPDGRMCAPETRDAFVAQERRYNPDLDDGVRVNIAPLQKAGLLAANALATKDVEKAIAERAEWRADERRWCREGKLTQPGWWID